MIEHDEGAVHGLPGRLPPGERILWQGGPDWRVLARTAFHTRLIAGYFGLLAAVALLTGGEGHYTGVAMTLALGAGAVALLHLLAWGSARSTVYTLTDRRIVLRIGMAVPKCINLPLTQIAAIDLAARSDGTGDMPLQLLGTPRLGYLALWPYARAWRISRPQPMLRAVPNAADVAALIARTCLSANPNGRIAAVEAQSEPVRGLAGAQAA